MPMPERVMKSLGRLLAASLLYPCIVHADGLVLGGSQWSQHSDFSYLAWMQAAPGDRIGEGYFGTVFASLLGYDYRSGTPAVTVQTRAPGLEIGGGHAWRSEAWSISLSALGGYRHYIVDPEAAAADDSPMDGVWSLTPQLMLRRDGAQWLAEGIANYSLGPDTQWMRGRVARRLGTRARLGIEAVRQLGPGYRIEQFGALLAADVAAGWTLDLSAGVTRNDGLQDEPYVALAFVRAR